MSKITNGGLTQDAL